MKRFLTLLLLATIIGTSAVSAQQKKTQAKQKQQQRPQGQRPPQQGQRPPQQGQRPPQQGAPQQRPEPKRRPVNQFDIEMVTFADGRQYVHANNRRDRPIVGMVRINPGYDTEYIDAQFKDGYPEGEWKYYKNEILTNVSNFHDGYKHGIHIELNQNGTPKLKSTYEQGKKAGTWYYYNFDGKIERLDVYDKNNNIVKKVTYYVNGAVESDRNYKDGMEHGLSKQFTETGQLKAENNYQMGKKVGTQVLLVEGKRGDYLQIANYNDAGDLDGEYAEIYMPDKDIKIKGNYRNGRREGRWLIGHPVTKQVYKEEIYANGMLKSSVRL